MNTESTRPLALIAGESSGIGLKLARVAAGQGYDLVVAARRAEHLSVLATELADTGAQVTQVVADLADPTGAPKVMAALKERPVDVLVHDAGAGAAVPAVAAGRPHGRIPRRIPKAQP